METVQKKSNPVRKGTCIEFFSAYQDLDTERMVGLATPDATVWFKPLGDDGKGLFKTFGKDVWSGLISAFPDLDNTIDVMSSDNDEITCKVSIFGTQEKDFLGLPSKGLRFESDHIFVFRFDEADKITDLSIDWDHQNFVRQLS